MTTSKRSLLMRYAVALIAVGSALLLTKLVPLKESASTALFFAAVMVSAWYGGLVPGLVVIFIAVTTIDYLFVLPFYVPGAEFADLMRLGVFVLVAFLISSLNAKRREIEAALRLAHQDLELRVKQRTVELAQTNDTLLAEINERKRAEETLLHKENHFRALIENSSDGITRVDSQGTVLYTSPSSSRITGYDMDDLVGRSFLGLIHPEDHARAVSQFQEIATSPASKATIQCRVLHRDGEARWVEGIVNNLLEEPSVQAIVVNYRDVSERIVADHVLRESEERYRRLFEFNPCSMWVYDCETLAFLAVNDAAVENYGYTRAEFAAMTVLELRAADRVSALIEDASRLSTGCEKSGIWKHRKKDGTLIDAEISSYELLFDGRRARLVLANDITARTQAEKALRASEERYRELFENANDILYTHDLAGNFTSINKAGERITGYTADEIRNVTIGTIVAPEHLKRVREMIARKLGQGGTTTYEVELMRKDGKRSALEISSRLIYQQGKPVEVQGIGRDLTEYKRLGEQLRQSQKMEAIGRLAGGIAHDFNNMLTGILGFSDLLLSNLGADDPIRGGLEEIKKAGERTASLTRQLLAFSRKQVLLPRILNLNNVVADMDKMLRRLIGEDIDLGTTLDPGLQLVKADPGQVEQVILNLCVNARDAMPQGGKLTIETANVELDEEYAREHVEVRPGPYVMLAVSDNGSGIDESIKANLFEPFLTTKEPGKGTGLGLATVYGIVKQSGGFIYVYSEPGCGASFKIYLPRAEASARLPEPEKTVAPRPAGGTETILLVEDEEAVQSLVRTILRRSGYTVVLASNGEEALAASACHSGPIHLMVTDVVMPLMSGAELAQRLASLRPDMKVLFMSGYTDEAIVRHGMLDTDMAFLQKPFTPAGLARKVREVLDQPQAVATLVAPVS